VILNRPGRAQLSGPPAIGPCALLVGGPDRLPCLATALPLAIPLPRNDAARADRAWALIVAGAEARGRGWWAPNADVVPPNRWTACGASFSQ